MVKPLALIKKSYEIIELSGPGTEKECFLALSDLYSKHGDTEEAEFYALAAQESEESEQYQTAILRIATICQEQKDISRAIEYLKKISNRSFEATYHLATIYEEYDDVQDAIRWYGYIKELDPKFFALANLGLCHIYTHSTPNLEKAKQSLRAALKTINNFNLLGTINSQLIIDTVAELEVLYNAQDYIPMYERHEMDSLLELARRLANKSGLGLSFDSRRYAHKQELTSYPNQYEVLLQITNGLLPLLQTQFGYDAQVIKNLTDKRSLEVGICHGLSYLFLYAAEHDTEQSERKRKSKQEETKDNLGYFEECLELLLNTNFRLLAEKELLDAEELKVINKLDRFLQLIILYQASVFSIDPDVLGPSAYAEQNRQFSVAQQFSSDTKERRIDDVHVQLTIKQIPSSSFNSFIVNINGVHAVALKRTKHDRNQFLLYEPNAFTDSNNPLTVYADQLETIFKAIQNNYGGQLGDVYATGFNFTAKPSEHGKPASR